MIPRRLAAPLAAAALAVGPLLWTHSPASARPVKKLDLRAVRHDSRAALYRSPFGAVPAGTPVTLRLRTGRDATGVQLFEEEVDQSGSPVASSTHPMTRDTAYSHGAYVFWKATFSPAHVNVYQYAFKVSWGHATSWYGNNFVQNGGVGTLYHGSRRPDQLYRLTSYDPSFHAPGWAQDAIIYQIFPDRFYNGDTSNDNSLQDPVYDGIHPTVHASWNEKPQGGFDFFGGDLQGIVDKLDYLKALGINTLYLNPIFKAPSNHKYDTSDYYAIDPHFGTLATFQTLLKAAHSQGIRVILDGVFNHTGSDSVYFNRYAHFAAVGAYQSKNSPYFPWYHFESYPTQYDSFEGIDTLPQLQENDAVKDFIFRTPDSVAQHWLAQGTDGWRLDAAHFKSHAWWQQFRQSVKARFPDSILIAEADLSPINATPWLLGNEMDGVMNYRFREDILRFFAQGRGTQAPLAQPQKVTSFYDGLMSIVEDYPRPALYSSMNLVDSHDTERILTDLLGNKRALEQVATFQMTWLGAPTIYYGDETGLTGGGDPDDRRPFPWNARDTSLERVYSTVIHVRSSHSAFRDGNIVPLVLDNKHRIFAYERQDAAENVAVVLNSGKAARTVQLRIRGARAGERFTDPFTGKTYVSRPSIKVKVPALGQAILVPATP